MTDVIIEGPDNREYEYFNIHILEYPDPRLSGFFQQVRDNRLYQALVKYLLTEAFSFQVRANEDFNDP